MTAHAAATVALGDALAELDALLAPDSFQDFGPNGLQVPGRERVATVVTGVSANLALLEAAVARDADLLVVHHGLVWDHQSRRLSRRAARRLRTALEADLNVAMYHLPLDAHPRLGNSTLLADALGGGERVPFGRVRGHDMGVLVRFRDPLDIDALRRRVASACDREPLVFPFGPPRIERLAVLSGGGANQIGQAIAAGADAYLTGEPAEHIQAEAAEGAIHFLAAGHHATERLGVQALGAHLAERFGVRHEFVDVPNPI